MESGPFNRKSWMTKSLRVTAKELSLVGGKGKSNAIAERFTKYQKAAEEASSDKKKGSVESKPFSLRSGNLSALKKRWEQEGNQDQEKTDSVPPPSRTAIRRRHSALTRPTPIREEVPPVQNPAPPTDQGGQRAAGRVQPPPAVPQGEDQKGMDRYVLTHRSTLEKVEEQVPTSPTATCEKAKVPLNKLSMNSERAEVSVMKDCVPEKPAPKSPAYAHKKDSTTAECNGETAEPTRVTKKFRLPERERCISCTKVVYPLEKLEVNQHVYHKNCFCCSHCKTKLSLSNYASLHDNIYCKPHYNQLFKAKGNYEEGFGLRPHKELWEPRADGDESEEALKPKQQPETVKSPVEVSPETQPAANGDLSPPVKVTDLTALLEMSQQKNSAEKLHSADRPAETRRLRIAWPPPAGEGQSGMPMSPVTEGHPSSRPWKAKWPPEDDVQASYHSTERSELKNLRRSTSLKERCRPFTLVAKPTQKTTPVDPKELRRPLRSLMEWKKSFEEKQSSEERSNSNDKEVQEEKKEKPQTPSEVSANGSETEQREERSEETQRRNVSAEKEVKRIVKQISLKGVSPEASPPSSPPPQPEESHASQDVDFREEDKEGNDTEDLSAEDIIKKNRYYDDDDDDSVV